MDKAMKDALIDRPAPVVVKELEWVEDGDGWGAVNPFNTDEFLYMAQPSCWQMTQEPCWELFEAPQTDDDELPIKGACFDELDALKTACQADYARRILSAVNAVSETRIAELEAEVAHLRRVEAGAVRQADELAALRGVVEAARDANTPTLSPRSLAWARAEAEKLEARDAAMRGVVEAARRVDACEDPEAEETAHAFDDLRKRLVALDALTKAEG